MPWESKTVEKLREEFVQAAKASNNFSLLCREFRITRRTGYKWLERSENGESMLDQSKCPKHIANKTPIEIEKIIIGLRQENPGWGAKTIKQVLENQGFNGIPCSKTVNNILNRNNCISKEESLKHKSFVRFEKDNCNVQLQLWRDKYNQIRPHEAIRMQCPADVYVPSKRKYNDAHEKHIYGGEFHVIKVNSWGYVRFDNWQIYLSETMINEYIEFRHSQDSDSFIACYRNFKIAEFSCQTGQLINRSISRL